jgi:hydroxyacyl-ACP dehydratase HTD2-like protein with hotdog domain
MLVKSFLASIRSIPVIACKQYRIVPRRHTSTAQNVISDFFSKKSNPALHPIESTDFLSPTQSHLLSLTLQPYLPFSLPNAESTLPQGHHIVFFPTAAVPESRLDSDGTETTYNPGHPFNRRMWAGGHIEWSKDTDLHVGKRTKEKMELEKVDAKHRGGGGELIVMSICKTLYTEDNSEAIRETRQWVFLKDGDPSAAQTTKKPRAENKEKRETAFQHSVELTPAALFRYSALIFNSHAIHLSKEHCVKEGHPNLVVHGPLTLSLLLEAVRGTVVGKRWKSVTYRAVGPAYVGEKLSLNVGIEKDGRLDAWAEKGEGVPVMKVNVELW